MHFIQRIEAISKQKTRSEKSESNPIRKGQKSSKKSRNNKMGRLFFDHINGLKLYSCAACDTNLTNKNELISTRFTGATGELNIVTSLKWKYKIVFVCKMSLSAKVEIFCKTTVKTEKKQCWNEWWRRKNCFKVKWSDWVNTKQQEKKEVMKRQNGAALRFVLFCKYYVHVERMVQQTWKYAHEN